MKYKMVLFDFDGTLVKTYELVQPELEQLIRDHGFHQESTEELQHSLRNLSMMEILQRFDISTITAVNFTRKLQNILKEKIDQLQFHEGILELISMLRNKGTVMGVVSSNSTENIRSFFEFKQIEGIEYIDGGLTLFGKDKKIRNVIKKSGFEPTDVVYVGDEVRDIDAGRDAGTDTLAVTWGINARERLVAAGPTYIVDTNKELIQLLDEKT